MGGPGGKGLVQQRAGKGLGLAVGQAFLRVQQHHVAAAVSGYQPLVPQRGQRAVQQAGLRPGVRDAALGAGQHQHLIGGMLEAHLVALGRGEDRVFAVQGAAQDGAQEQAVQQRLVLLHQLFALVFFRHHLFDLVGDELVFVLRAGALRPQRGQQLFHRLRVAAADEHAGRHARGQAAHRARHTDGQRKAHRAQQAARGIHAHIIQPGQGGGIEKRKAAAAFGAGLRVRAPGRIKPGRVLQQRHIACGGHQLPVQQHPCGGVSGQACRVEGAQQLLPVYLDHNDRRDLARHAHLAHIAQAFVLGHLQQHEARVMAFRQLREPCVIALALRHALQGVIGGGLEAAHIAHHKPRARVIEVYAPGELVRDEKIPQRDGKLVRLRGQGAGQLPQVFEQRVGVRDLNGSGIAVQLLQAGIDAFLHISRQGGVGLHHRAVQHMQDIEAQQRAEQQARKHYGQNGAQPAHGMFFAVRHKTRPLFRFLRCPDRTILS